MIFSSFFGCCIAMALEAAAMATKYWVVSEARRKFDNGSLDFSSDGKVNFGLFKGKKELNYGYGTRVSAINGEEMSCGTCYWSEYMWVRGDVGMRYEGSI